MKNKLAKWNQAKAKASKVQLEIDWLAVLFELGGA